MRIHLICYFLLHLSAGIKGIQWSDFFYRQGKYNVSTEISSSGDFTDPVSSYSPNIQITEHARNEDLQTAETTNTATQTDLYQESSRQLVQYSTLDTQNEPVNSSTSNETEDIPTESPKSISNASTSKASSEITEETIMNKSTFITTSAAKINGSLPQPEEAESDEEEKVVIGKPSFTQNTTSEEKSKFKKIYIRAVELISDTYTLSILLPVAAGVIFASTIIVTITACKCLRRRCRHNRMRRKALPDSVKNLRPSDRARLLAESSDDEF